MLDYDKLKQGDHVLCELNQQPGKKYHGVVQVPVQWARGKGMIGVLVDHHADNPRWLIVHRKLGVMPGRGFDELHEWMTREAVNKPYTSPCYHYSIPFGSKQLFVGSVWKDTEPEGDAAKPWRAHCCRNKASYGHLGDFATEVEAELALRTLVSREGTG